MPTLIDAILAAAQLAGAGFASTADEDTASTTTELIDVALADQFVNEDSGKGAWVYRSDPVNFSFPDSDTIRRVSSFNTQASALVPARAWVVAPDTTEPYQLYGMLPPFPQPGTTESWKGIVNRALSNIWQVAEFPVGRGGGGQFYDLAAPVVTLFAAVTVLGGSGTTITAPSNGGWTLVRTDNQSTNVQLAIYRKRALLSDPGSWTWTATGQNAMSGIIVAVVDCNPSAGVDTSGVATVTPSAVAVTAPSVTTAQNNELVLRFIAGASGVAWTGPDTARKLADVVDTLGTATGINSGPGLAAFASYVGSAGASGTLAATASAATTQVATTVALAIRNAYRVMVVAGVTVGASSVDQDPANPGSNGGTLRLARPADLPVDQWTPNRQHVRKVVSRHITTGDEAFVQSNQADIDLGKNGKRWEIREDGPNRVLWLSSRVNTDQTVVLEVQRPYPSLALANDQTDAELDQIARRTKYELFDYLNGVPPTRGQYVAERAEAMLDYLARYGETRPTPALVM